MPVRVLSLSEHGKQELTGDLKGCGYGTPVFLEYEAGGTRKQVVLETMSPSSFGHDHFSDRAQAILWEHSAFNNLPRHVRSLDSGAFLRTGKIVSTGQAEEFFLLTEFIEGQGYFRDLDRIAATGVATAADHGRADRNVTGSVRSERAGIEIACATECDGEGMALELPSSWRYRHGFEAKVSRCPRHVAIVRVDLPEAMVLSADQVERMGRPQEHGRCSSRIEMVFM